MKLNKLANNYRTIIMTDAEGCHVVYKVDKFYNFTRARKAIESQLGLKLTEVIVPDKPSLKDIKETLDKDLI